MISLEIEEVTPRRRKKRWASAHAVLWLNLNLSTLVFLALCIYTVYDTLSNWRLLQAGRLPVKGFRPEDSLVAIGVIWLFEGPAWTMLLLPGRPFARIAAAALGGLLFLPFFLLSLLITSVWDMKLDYQDYVFLYVGLSYLAFAFWGDDGTRIGFARTRRGGDESEAWLDPGRKRPG